jgi:HTH-type transcriptional regulator / antitoxin HigA
VTGHDEAFTPRWASPPGATIKDVLDERQMTSARFAEVLQIDVEAVEELISGRTPMTVGLARKLSDHLGATVEFWLTRDVQFREDIVRSEGDKWAADLPLKHMESLGWITSSDDWKGRLRSCLQFFAARDFRDWQAKYQPILQGSHFRFPSTTRQNPAAVLAWLRQGEIVTSGQLKNPWNPGSFRASLQRARHLTRERDPSRFLPNLINLCTESGVSFAVVRAPEGCPVSGVARFTINDQPMIILSARYLADDHFWFTFFHEAGHLLLHGPGNLYLDDDAELNGEADAPVAELEANEFAETVLIPDGIPDEMQIGRLSAREAIRASQDIGISPGILVGQLQHRRIIGFDTLNGLKRRYKWVGSNLEKA